jgi:hypothetical protein
MPKKQRIQLDLSPMQQAKLKAMRDQLDAASYSEIFRRAMLIYGKILDAEQAGRKFGFIEGGDGEEHQFVEIAFI